MTDHEHDKCSLTEKQCNTWTIVSRLTILDNSTFPLCSLSLQVSMNCLKTNNDLDTGLKGMCMTIILFNMADINTVTLAFIWDLENMLLRNEVCIKKNEEP